VKLTCWDGGDSSGWVLRAKYYFQFHRTPEILKVEIVTDNFEGKALHWFDLLVVYCGEPTSKEFLEGVLLARFGSSAYENIDGESKQTSTVDECIYCFEQLSDQTYTWSEVLLVETFIEGLWSEIRREVKVRRP
jgi:hypothetical protein